ncbi:MAG: DUF2971 domain-containing protein [Patescibacteria group bacterium]|nr:DUF2971 domain-containing protein [Patescibacteria group bacterium]
MNEKIYYHFLSSKNAIDDLEQKRIKISLIDELNDPFELLPYLRYKEAKKRKTYHNIRKIVSKKYGLLCFSKKWEEPLLWGHYADKHRGIAIGFEILKDKILRVKYNTVPKRIEFELTKNQEKNIKLFLDLAKTKYKVWSYEEEYRILVELNNRNDGHYFIQFGDRLKVKEIVLGCNFDKKKYKKIKKLANRLHAKVIPTRQGWEDYKIRQCGTKTKEFQNIK